MPLAEKRWWEPGYDGLMAVILGGSGSSTDAAFRFQSSLLGLGNLNRARPFDRALR